MPYHIFQPLRAQTVGQWLCGRWLFTCVRASPLRWLRRKPKKIDLELSWQVNDSVLQHWLREEENFSRTYFSIRNRVYIERNFVKNKYIYDANIILYFISKIIFKNRQSIYYHFRHPHLVCRRWKLIAQAIQAGKAADFQTPPPAV